VSANQMHVISKLFRIPHFLLTYSNPLTCKTRYCEGVLLSFIFNQGKIIVQASPAVTEELADRMALMSGAIVIILILYLDRCVTRVSRSDRKVESRTLCV
jgi:hypothetical protein